MKGIRMKRHEYVRVKYNIDINEIREESELEEMSFENMILFYLEELIAIENGANIRETLSLGIRNRMREYGMFIRTSQIGHRGYHPCLSQKARQLIKKLHGN